MLIIINKIKLYPQKIRDIINKFRLQNKNIYKNKICNNLFYWNLYFIANIFI